MSFGLHSLLAMGLYFAAHAFRCVRLYILSLGSRRGGARLVAAHCLTAWPSAVIPFKAGELLRLAGFSAAVRSPLDGVAIWFIERLSDALALTALIIALSFMFPMSRQAMIILYLTSGFIVACAFGAWLTFEVLPFLRNDLLLRSRSRKGLVLLRFLHRVQVTLAAAQRLLIGRFSATLLAGFVIWGCEFAAIALFAIGAGASERSALNANFFAGDVHAIEQRLPVFVALSVIGVVILGTIIVRRWPRHES